MSLMRVRVHKDSDESHKTSTLYVQLGQDDRFSMNIRVVISISYFEQFSVHGHRTGWFLAASLNMMA